MTCTCNVFLHSMVHLDILNAHESIVYKSNIRSAILYRSEVWYLNKNEMGILQKTEISMVRRMCGVQLKDGKGAKDFVMLCLSESIDLWSMANNVS